MFAFSLLGDVAGAKLNSRFRNVAFYGLVSGDAPLFVGSVGGGRRLFVRFSFCQVGEFNE